MEREHENTREEVVEPGAEHPAGGPAAPPEPDAAASMPAGDPEAPVGPVAETDAGTAAGMAAGTAAQTASNGSEPVDHHEKLLERDLEELTAKAEKADEYLE